MSQETEWVMSTLSTVAEFGDYRRKRQVAEFGNICRICQQSPNSATVAKTATIVAENGDCRRIRDSDYSRQCGQGLIEALKRNARLIDAFNNYRIVPQQSNSDTNLQAVNLGM